MPQYLVCAARTAPIEGTLRITKNADIPHSRTDGEGKPNTVVKIAINGGPGSGKDSFAKVAIKSLDDASDTVVILVAESARDVIDTLIEDGTWEQTPKDELLSKKILQEQYRRRDLAENLVATLQGKRVYIFFDRDETNNKIYGLFFRYYNPDTKILDQEGFKSAFESLKSVEKVFKDVMEEMDRCLIMRPLNYEENYPCAHPKFPKTPIDTTRSESYEMALQLHCALEHAAKETYGYKALVIRNTDTLNLLEALQTIKQRAKGPILIIRNLMDQKIKEFSKPPAAVSFRPAIVEECRQGFSLSPSRLPQHPGLYTA